MILPQSSAFETLRNRLTCISSLGVLHLIPKSTHDPLIVEGIDFDVLLKHFQSIQEKHERHRKQAAQEKEGNNHAIALLKKSFSATSVS